jgi:iron complex transport system substrate-binding protein
MVSVSGIRRSGVRVRFRSIRTVGRGPSILASFAIAVALAAMAACDRAPAESAREPGAERPVRIVSLSPALTRTVCMLGGQGTVVGRTPWCEAPGAMVVGTLEDRNLEAIAALHPTLILRQSSVADPALETVAASGGATVHTWHFDGVDDVRSGLDPLAKLLAAGGIAGAEAAARDLVARHQQAIAVPVRSTLPVLFLFSVDPPMAFGSGTYVDDLWRAMGGVNAVGKAGYPALTAEDVIRLAPSAVVVIGRGSLPSWLGSASPVQVQVDAPDLLEPSARMLVDGPASLHRVDDSIAAARSGG